MTPWNTHTPSVVYTQALPINDYTLSITIKCSYPKYNPISLPDSAVLLLRSNTYHQIFINYSHFFTINWIQLSSDSWGHIHQCVLHAEYRIPEKADVWNSHFQLVREMQEPVICCATSESNIIQKRTLLSLRFR